MSSDCLSSVCFLCCHSRNQTIIILSISHMLGGGNQRHGALESFSLFGLRPHYTLTNQQFAGT